ncbi:MULTISPECIES: LURP-one-related/scramblase family protein [Vagococcus]|uniref:YxjI n=1 Tax=Vagococcus fluvialis bH819 TaxID=1255619 RepID=A0A1X6WLB7_9ENTE|nr:MULTISPECIES: hypothetical protein [Vagococcus]SLM85049.1 hypothetical protein FM121_03060 [Vagococcus fluvialis bH819]HCM88535.1 hypothetical protein [Vagococcus sp.]
MTVYYIQQNLLSAKVRTVIKDTQDRPVFLLVGSWGTRGDSISIYNLDGKVLASAKQTTFAIKSQFEIYSCHDKVGSLSRLFSINRDFYYIKNLRWLAVGDINHQEYKIYRFNELIMEMTKVLSRKGEYYKIVVHEDEDAAVCICIAAVLDYWARKGNKKEELVNKKIVNIQLS